MIGRAKELTLLKNDYASTSSSIFVCYGRRRIGKSYLIEHYLSTLPSPKKSSRIFQFEGIEGQNTSFQIKSFHKKLNETFTLNHHKGSAPKNWEDALQLLTDNLPKKSEKFVIYFDEFQWMAAGRSVLPALLKKFWDNDWKKKKVQLILCGSVSSYMLGKVIKSKALYGRIHAEININFLSIAESALFFKKEKSYLEVIKYLILFGGVPKYLADLNSHYSLEKNIEKIFFDKNSSYINEFEKVFYSQFKEHQMYEKIVKSIAAGGPQNLESISKKIGLKSGGGLKFYLENLESAQFIKGYFSNPQNMKSKIIKYRLTDPFIRFYLEFVEPNKRFIKESRNSNSAMQKILKDKINTFLGFGFENFCLINAMEIAHHLHIADSVTSYGPLNMVGQAQIDLVYFREQEQIIHLVEIKFKNKEIDTSIMLEIEKKIEVLKKMYPKYSIEKNLISLSRPSKKLQLSDYFDQILLVEDLIARRD